MKIAVIGAGKMGVWFAKFFQQKGYSVVLADRKAEKLSKLKKELSVATTTDFREAVAGADQILLCVSINAIDEVSKSIASAIKSWSSRHGYLLHQRSPN